MIIIHPLSIFRPSPLLREKDMYGYQLVEETGARSRGMIVTQEGSLYPVLYRMLENGLVSEHRVQSGKKMVRIYYHLEPAGEEYLNQLVKAYKKTAAGMQLIFQSVGVEE